MELQTLAAAVVVLAVQLLVLQLAAQAVQAS
jgi:hypothetical protein